MGNQASNRVQFRVASLNFMGVTPSPFQYYSSAFCSDEQQLDPIFQAGFESIYESFPQNIQKQATRIDRVTKQIRYSPMFNKLCGVEKGQFISQDDFKKIWYEKIESQFKILQTRAEYKLISDYLKDPHEKNQRLQLLQKFDYILFQSILKYVYSTSQIESIRKKRSTVKYMKFMEMMLSKRYLKEQNRINAVLDLIQKQNLDVLFLQQATRELCLQIQSKLLDYRLIKSQEADSKHDFSLIVFKHVSFRKAHIARKGNLKFKHIDNDNILDDDYKKKFLKWDLADTAVVSIDNFLLICTKADYFTNHMLQNLETIKKKFQKKHLILAADIKHTNIQQKEEKDNKYSVSQFLNQLNQQDDEQQKKEQDKLDNQQKKDQNKPYSHVNKEQKDKSTKKGKKQKYTIFPTKEVTRLKKRTNMQLQRNKTQLVAKKQNLLIFDSSLLQKENQEGNPNFSEGGIYTLETHKQNETGMQQVSIQKKPQVIQCRVEIGNSLNKDKLIKISILPNNAHVFDSFILLQRLFIPPRTKIYRNEDQIKQQEKLGFQPSSSEEEDIEAEKNKKKSKN